MYDSVNNDHSDSISGDTDRVSGAVDSDYDVNDYDKDENAMPYDKDENAMPYDKDEKALSIQKKFKGKYDDNICNANGQYRNEWYKRAENMVPQLDGTYNVSDDSILDSHSYLDLVSSNIIVHRM